MDQADTAHLGLAFGMTPTTPSSPCGICRLHDDAANVAAYEIARTDLWLLRHHPDPAPLAGWLLLDARRHLPGPLDFSDGKALSWGQTVRHACLERGRPLPGCDRRQATGGRSTAGA